MDWYLTLGDQTIFQPLPSKSGPIEKRSARRKYTKSTLSTRPRSPFDDSVVVVHARIERSCARFGGTGSGNVLCCGCRACIHRRFLAVVCAHGLRVEHCRQGNRH